MKRKLISTFILFAFWILVGGCAALLFKPPTVTLAGIEVIEANLFEQRFVFKLRVQNPNNADISLTGGSFTVELNGRPLATGVSNKPITVPRLTGKILEVNAVSDLSGILRQMGGLIRGENKALTYRIKGQLWSDSFGELDFDKSGRLELPKSGQGEGTTKE